jgi:hypothetical protein
MAHAWPAYVEDLPQLYLQVAAHRPTCFVMMGRIVTCQVTTLYG